METRRLMRSMLIAGAAVAISVGGAAAQIPDEFENLTILPKDISKRELIDIMRNMSGALGFRCHNCHKGEPGPSLDGYDFVSDEKKNKRVARDMMKMVSDINGKYIAPMDTGHDAKVQVNCRTCHHGQERPRSLLDILDETYKGFGPEAMLAKYAELHEKYYGRDSFDFGEYVFDDLAGRIMQAGKPEDAMALIELHAKTYPASSHLEVVQGEIQRAAGNEAEAIKHYEAALKLDPENRMAKHRLGEMKGGD
jgi:hypothetical protein